MDYYSGGSGETNYSNMPEPAPSNNNFKSFLKENYTIILLVLAIIIVILGALFLLSGINSGPDDDIGKDTNSKLSSLTVNGGSLNPAFDKETKEYTITLNPTNTEENITFSCETVSSKAIVTGCDEVISLKGKMGTIHTIRVEAEDTSVTRYTFNIKR